MFIMVGVPGSGKSHKAREIQQEQGGLILSTDSIFESTDGTTSHYLWTPNVLGAAHQVNQEKTRVALSRGLSVIIDNTNITPKQRQPYIVLADSFNIKWEIVEPDTPWRYNAEECAKRNSHGVPLASIIRMLQELNSYWDLSC
jgi:predicted kinase